MRPRAVCFDAGLVLLGPDGALLTSEVHARLGLQLDGVRCVSAYRRTIHARDTSGSSEQAFDFWSAWASFAGVPAAARDKVATLVARLHEPDFDLWRAPEPDARVVLSGLQQRGVRIAIVSNSNGDLIGQFRRARFDAYVDCYIDSRVEGVSKPQPEIFALALARLRVSAAHAWFVGDDHQLDVVPATRCGFGRVLHYDPLGLYANGLRSLREILNEVDAGQTREGTVGHG